MVFLYTCTLFSSQQNFDFSLSASENTTDLYHLLQGSKNHSADTTWAVIGAGPAGVAIIGVLLDLGVHEKMITWIDPEFNIGRLGKYYYSVPGNAKTADYIDFVNQCKTFSRISSPALDLLRTYDRTTECNLAAIIGPYRQRVDR